MGERYNFNISLSVLNHLGRNLYRNVITVLGEAISNSWDADAHNVWITIDRESKCMSVLDDGHGMSSEDFQEKFLKIGYSKRKGNIFSSAAGRPFIGRKGIGKLALLSCARRVHIATRVATGEVVGGVIDNSGLDAAIKDDLNSQDYTLELLDSTDIECVMNLDSGTYLKFESISDGILNTVDYLKKAIALNFRFSLIDPQFKIYVNGDPIDQTLLKDLASGTQFLWKIGSIDDPIFSQMANLYSMRAIVPKISIRGYIATMEKPSQAKIRGTQERVTIDLFVNGRLREKDILRHVPTSRIVENYAYGQIHFDELDTGESKDIFTSSRESIVADDPRFQELVKEVERIFRVIIEEWDDLRRKAGNDGDPDNTTIPKKARKAQELFNTTLNDMQAEGKFIKRGSIVEEWARALSEEAQFNVPSYTECFVAENLLRHYVTHVGMTVSPEAAAEAAKWRKKEGDNKGAANISYDVRTTSDDLYYLDMTYLANLVDKVPGDKPKTSGLSRSAVVYKPMRDAVGHTSLLTPLAKQQLNTEYENIKARLVQLLKDIQETK